MRGCTERAASLNCCSSAIRTIWFFFCYPAAVARCCRIPRKVYHWSTSNAPPRRCLSAARISSRSMPCVNICPRSEEHTSELQSHVNLVCRLLLEKKNKKNKTNRNEKRRLK